MPQSTWLVEDQSRTWLITHFGNHALDSGTSSIPASNYIATVQWRQQPTNFVAVSHRFAHQDSSHDILDFFLEVKGKG